MRRPEITGVALISALAADCDFVAGNRRLREIVSPEDGLFGWVTLNAGYPAESQEEQRRHEMRRGMVGAALFGHNGRPVTLEDAREILNAQRRYAKPVALHVPDGEAVQAGREIAAAFPAMKFVFSGMGGDDWRSAVAVAKQHLNVYLEISGSLDSDKIAHAASVLTPRKLLYGSGLPDGSPSLTRALVESDPTLTRAGPQPHSVRKRRRPAARRSRTGAGRRRTKTRPMKSRGRSPRSRLSPGWGGVRTPPRHRSHCSYSPRLRLPYCSAIFSPRSWDRAAPAHFYRHSLQHRRLLQLSVVAAADGGRPFFPAQPLHHRSAEGLGVQRLLLAAGPGHGPHPLLPAGRAANGPGRRRAGLLWLIYRFYRHCLPDDFSARLTAFGFACLSSGFGWVQWQHWQDKNLPGGPVDAWQPEAYTFLSIYTSALMTVSTVLDLRRAVCPAAG